MEQYSLFEKSVAPKDKIVNVASIPQRSPFRYPGGKTWFVPRLRKWLNSKKEVPEVLVEPFAGGGIVSLTAVCEGLVESALMVELDDDVAAVWEALSAGAAPKLADRILQFKMNDENAAFVLSREPNSLLEKAFKTIVKNRCLRGGILAAGSGLMKKGESGKGIRSRWYPQTLAKRLQSIHQIRRKITFRHADAFDVLSEYQCAERAVFFIDPPYTAGGKNAGRRLYKHCALDHDALFQKCVRLKGDFIMTYDNATEVRNLAKKYDLQAKPISMKNTHHAKMTELVIGRNLHWMEA